MMRLKTAAILLCASVALAGFVVFAGLTGCESSSPGSAAVETPPPAVPQIIHQTNGEELLQLDSARVPGAAFAEVPEVELPSMLRANAPVTSAHRPVSRLLCRSPHPI